MRQAHDLPIMSDTEKELRLLLCVAHAGGLGYYDDGEAFCGRMHPTIDFMRDSPAEIRSKINERALKTLSLNPEPKGNQNGTASAPQHP